MHSFSNLFHKVLYMFQTVPLSIIRSTSTLYTRNKYFCILTGCLCMTNLTEVFPCFFLSYKAKARLKPANTGHGSHSS
jgi:hypothetical protein